MFQEVKQKVQTQFSKLSAQPLFRVDVDRDKIWEVYLNAFAEDKRQENNCNCCKSFLRQFSGIVAVENNKLITLWDFEVDDEEYKEPIKAVGRYIRSLPIAGIYLNDFKKCGHMKLIEINEALKVIGKRDTSASENEAKLEIVKFVIQTKLDEAEARKTRAEKASQKEFLASLLEKKRMAQLEGLSIEEIQKQIDAL